MSTLYSTSVGVTPQGVSIDNNRRLYNFGHRIAELAPEESFFTSYLNRFRKDPTDDPVFKVLERRHQWQRRNFEVQANKAAVAIAASLAIEDVRLTVHYDKYGRVVAGDTMPEFILDDQVLVVEGQIETAAGSNVFEDTKLHVRVTDNDVALNAAYRQVDLLLLAVGGDEDYATTYAGYDVKLNDGQRGQVIGSVFAEATGAPDGWTDHLYDREGYTQIFKTSIPFISGTTQATRYRGIANEYARIWAPKLKEHKVDMAHAFLFNVGGNAIEGGTTPKRYSLGFIPYIERNGEVQEFSYSSTSYDTFMGWLKTFMAPEKGGMGRKLVLTSRNIVEWFNKLGDNGFLKNTVGAAAYQIRVDQVAGSFGHNVTRVWTPFGELGVMPEMLLREAYEDYAIVVDLSQVAVRPLVANGISRDTFVKTNIQDNDLDARKDMALTEAGLWIGLPEVHAVLRWS